MTNDELEQVEPQDQPYDKQPLTVSRDEMEALQADSMGPSAPTAEYSLGVVLADSGREDAAAERLEHMILTHPGSALVPEARRLLDRVRGAIPNND